MTDDPHPANACHRCGEQMSNYKPATTLASPGIGICPEHGVSYDETYRPPDNPTETETETESDHT